MRQPGPEPTARPTEEDELWSSAASGATLREEVLPQGNGLDLVELNLSLQNLLDLALVRTLLHLLPTNQVQELGGEDEIPLHRLPTTDRK